jgi:ribose 5-phosphate isomerase B
MKITKIAIASDHAGFELKEKLKKWLQEKGFIIKDLGTNSRKITDYPDYAHPLALAIEKKESDIGISLCGSGNGINMTANKHQGIRSALCWNKEIAKLARQHNDSNICALPARFVKTREAKKIVEVFLSSEFEGGRHKRRIEKIPIK